MLTNIDKKSPKNRQKFYCKYCDYGCSKESDYKKHLLTRKHNILTNVDKNSPKLAKAKYECECGKEYKSRQGLQQHKKKCKYIEDDTEEIVESNNDNEPSYKDLLIQAMKQMQEQQTQIQEQNKEMSEMRKQMLDMVPLIGSNNNNTTNNNNFNLQLFLNDTCKDALNITDFLNSLQVQLKDLEYTTDNGHVNGITNIFKTALCNMEETKRPMHCTDLKREVLYIKDNDEWHKDENKEVIKSAVTKVVDKNLSNSEKWLDEHPNVFVSGSNDSTRYIKMTENSLGTGLETEQNKIVKNILREVIIDK
jgi:hypothetical protein